MLVDVAAVASSFLYSTGNRAVYSLIALPSPDDDVIQNINPLQCFNIICDDPDPICDYIINTLHRSATVYHAQVLFPTMKKQSS